MSDFNLKCDDCGKMKGRNTVCPYKEEVDGIIEKCVLCINCEDLRGDDI